MSATIRPARPGDVDGMMTLEAIFPSDRLSRRALRRFLRVDSARIWVAVVGHTVIADVILLLRKGSKAARIYSVVVAPEARGQGLGNRLVATAERAAKAAGRSRLRLEVRKRNSPARKLYAARGYQPVAALAGYYEDGSDGLRLEKPLLASRE